MYKMTTLGEFITVQGGYAFKSKDFCDSGIPVIKIKNVRSGFVSYSDTAYVSESTSEGLDRFYTEQGDILISMTGSGFNAPQSLVGRVAKVYEDEPKVLINQRVGRLKFNKNRKIHPNFAYYVLTMLSSIQYLVSNSTGSANQANISGETISSLPCPDVGYEESCKITSLLSSLDEKIVVNKQMNITLEKIAQRIFKSWFIDFDPVKANKEGIPFDGLSPEIQALFPSEFENSELGLIPKGWKVTTIDSEFNVVMGQSPKGTSYNEEGDGSVFYQGRKDFCFRFPSIRVYTTEPKKMANAEDTLLSVRAPVGDCNIALENCCIGRGLAALKHKSGCSSLTYYHVQNLSRTFDKYDAEGTVFGSINQKDLKALKVIKSSSTVEQAFSRIVTSLDDRIKENSLNISTLEKIRDKLLPKLMSGQISVGEAKQELAEAI